MSGPTKLAHVKAETGAYRFETFLLILAPAMTAFLSFWIGRYPVDPWTVTQILLARVLPIAQTWSDTVETVVLDVRLPRILSALAVGGSLSLSGAVYQGVDRRAKRTPLAG